VDLVICIDDSERRPFVGSHQRGVADDVGEQDGCELASLPSLRRGPDRFIEIVTLPPLGVAVLVGRQDVLIELEISSQKIVDERIEASATGPGDIADEVGIDVDANSTDEAILGTKDGDSGALELSRTDVQLIVDLVGALLAPSLQVKDEVRCTATDRRPVTTPFSMATSDRDGLTRLCRRISTPVFGNDRPN
jgi:hypothetical protein